MKKEIKEAMEIPWLHVVVVVGHPRMDIIGENMEF
jgi:hypothetical protein